MSFSSCIPLYLLLRSVSQLPSALSSFSDFRQAFASFLNFTLSSLTFRISSRCVFLLLRQLQTLSFVSLQFFELEVKLLLCKKKRPLGLGSSHPIYLPVKSHFLILIFTFDTYISYEFICYWNSVTYA